MSGFSSVRKISFTWTLKLKLKMQYGSLNIRQSDYLIMDLSYLNHGREDSLHCSQIHFYTTIKVSFSKEGFRFSKGSCLCIFLLFQGVLMLQDQYRAIMQYSIPKDMGATEKPPTFKASADWFCIKVICVEIMFFEVKMVTCFIKNNNI